MDFLLNSFLFSAIGQFLALMTHDLMMTEITVLIGP